MWAIVFLLSIPGAVEAESPSLASQMVIAAARAPRPPLMVCDGSESREFFERVRQPQPLPLAVAQAQSPFRAAFQPGGPHDVVFGARPDESETLVNACEDDFLSRKESVFGRPGLVTAAVKPWDWDIAFQPDLHSDLETQVAFGAWLTDDHAVVVFRVAPHAETSNGRVAWDSVREMVIPVDALWSTDRFESLRLWWPMGAEAATRDRPSKFSWVITFQR
jgi:hypothetical protein